MNQHHVLAWEIDPHNPNMFVMFCADRKLYSFDRRNGSFHQLLFVESISCFDSIMLYLHGDYICAVENFAAHGVVFDRDSGTVMPIEREDGHEDVSSYSIGFLERGGHTLLIHQTQWNRLDITDLTTGQLLTDRVVRIEKIGVDEKNFTQYDTENYEDFFHSLIHVAPDSKSFLSNGWCWHPIGMIECYGVEQFMESYEPGGYYTNWGTENWDIPCVFINNTTFVVSCSEDITDYEDKRYANQDAKYIPKILFYDMNTAQRRVLDPIKTLDADIFPMSKYGDLNGRFYFDKQTNQLIAMSTRGTYVLKLDGTVVAYRADITFPDWTPPCWKEYRPVDDCVAWDYSERHRQFHSWNQECQTMDVLLLEDLLTDV